MLVMAIVVAAVAGASLYYQEIADWWFLRSYQPSPAIAELAREAAMSDEGRDYFYVSDPQINEKQTFNKNCPTTEEASVLGCYTDQRIYLMRVEREELDGIMEVTAAHEMLHAAYDRLDGSTRSRLTELLEKELDQQNDERIARLIDRYEASGGSDVRHNELHSILPTQVAELSPELEEYYSRYFTDRSRVVGLYNQYESTFEDIRSRIESLRNQVDDLRGTIDTLEEQIAVQRQRVDELNTRLERHKRNNNTEAYNELVPEQNAAVNKYNSMVNRYQSLISRHNQKVEELNESVLLQNELVNSIDNNYQQLQ